MSVDISEAGGVRYLHFGSDWIQGAMRIARPYALELDYTREMMVPLVLRGEDWPRRVLIVGLGSASVLKFLWRHRPRARFTVVEIDPRVERVARQYFKLPDDPARIRLEIADGADFVIASQQHFDLILIDGFDADARSGRLDTLPFYLDCKTRLADDGLFCVNLLSRRKDFSKSVARLTEAFGEQLLILPSCDSGNAIAIGRTTAVPPAPTFDELRLAAATLKKNSGLNLLPTLARLSMFGRFPGGRLAL